MEKIGALLVDDEPDIRLLLRALIEREGEGLFVVAEAADGSEAIAAVERYDPAIIVIDERMPGMGGIEASTHIRANRPHQHIVLCTAYLDDALQARADAVGIARCVTKTDAAVIPKLLKALVRPPYS